MLIIGKNIELQGPLIGEVFLSTLEDTDNARYRLVRQNFYGSANNTRASLNGCIIIMIVNYA